MKEYTKITISVKYNLTELKKAYRHHYGVKGKVTKKEVAEWFITMLEADIETDLMYVKDKQP